MYGCKTATLYSVKDVFRNGISMVSIGREYQLDQQKVYKLGPYGHVLRKRWDSCVVSCATARKRKGFPFSSADLFLTFTSSKSTILEQDVLRLLDACASSGCECTGLDMVEFEPKAEKVDKGATVLPRDEYRSEKMRKCLKNSLLVIGVYAPEGFLAGKGQSALSLVENIVRGRSQPRRLVGFGRAIGDASLVATLHDIMVDPEYRGYGIGRRILLQLANQLDSRWDIVDVGALVPPDLQGFFEKCNFGPDSEGSRTMVLKNPKET